MVKRLFLIAYCFVFLFAAEDIPYTARLAGMGGEHTIDVHELSSLFSNFSFAAQAKRAGISFNCFILPGDTLGIYPSFSSLQPVGSLIIGGGVIYQGSELIGYDEWTSIMGLALPFSRRLFLSFTVKNVAKKNVILSLHNSSPEGISFGIGGGYLLKENLQIGCSFTNLTKENEFINFGIGIGYKPKFKGKMAFKNMLFATTIFWQKEKFALHLGSEAWWGKENLGTRIGLRIKNDTLNPIKGTLGLSFKTLNIEKTDFSIDYAILFPYNIPNKRSEVLHSLGISILLGDALKEEKERKRREQEVRALQIREEALRREREELVKLKKKIEEAKKELEKERLSLEEKRREALEALRELEGLKIQEEKEWLKIIAQEKAIHFASGSAEIPFPEGYKVLVKIGRFLKTWPGKKILIEGHTDNVPIGPKLKSIYPDNQALSEARAASIKKYFVEVEELPEKLITAKGYGETRPIVSNETEEGRSLNRRVEITILK